MPGAHAFLHDLAVVLCVAAVTTVLCHRLRQPVVLGYLLAGIIIGPHVPFRLVENQDVVRDLSELGVILVMFSLGLEFRLRRLFEMGPTVALVVVVEVSLMMWLGFVVARLLGWSQTASVFAGAVVAISSTTIIAKVFEEQKVAGKLRDLVYGVLVFEDLVAILLLATLATLGSGRSLTPEMVALTAGRLAAFVLGLLVAGMVVVPRLVRVIVRLGRAETILVASVGLCFALALAAQLFGYSVALGAFVAGALVAESGHERRVAVLVQPVRDVFAAVFFVAVGMSVDPRLIATHGGAVVALTLVVVAGKLAGISFGAFLAGHGVRTAVQAGLSLGQIGEFSFIIAGVAAAGGAPEPLQAVAVAVSVLTTLATPWMIRISGRAAIAADDALPRPLQTFAALYGSWVERLRDASAAETLWARLRRLCLLLLLDGVLLAVVVIGASLAYAPAARLLEGRLGLELWVAQGLVLVTAGGLALPLCAGIVRLARRVGRILAEAALPRAAGGADLAAAPRRALVVTLELTSVLLVGAPLVALTQPFLPAFHGAAVFLLTLVLLALAFWRSATNLEGHVRAGAHVIVEALASQARRRPTGEHSLEVVDKLLPGLGTPVALRLGPASPALGKTLAELNLRGATGATVLAITRGEQGLVIPAADEVLREGDVLALAGTQDALRTATDLLAGPAGSAPARRDTL